MWRCLRQSHSLWRQRAVVPQTATRCLSSEAGKGVPYESQLKDVKGAGSQAVPQSADAVIIGGGAIGCSILYHLTKLGMKNVVLLEKDQLTAGTTWHTAGLLWNLRPNDIDIQLIRHSRNLMKSLEEETGVHSGWVENGGLWVASNETRLNEFKRMQSLGKFFGIPSYHLSQAETKELYPLLDVSDVIGSIYSPEDGTIDPAGYCTGLSRAARSRGGQVITGCSVTDIKTGVDDFGTKRVKAVETNFGTIQTDNVVNACGVWAPHIGAMAGVNVPLVAMRHAYVVTEKIEGIQNMPNLRDHDASVYLKLQGDALCVGGYEPNPIFIDKMDSEFAFSLYELDWDVFLYNMEGIMKCVPAIAESGVKSTVCGPESFTADHKPLAGESPEVRGFHLCCGFNSGGMMFSGGFGWQMAEWIINGKPTLDMYSYDIRRFTTKLTDNSRWIKERSHESYAKNYSIVFPHDEPLAGRNMRIDALHQVLEDAGCVYQERQGWERPGWFSTSTTAHIRDYDYYGYYDYPANTNYTYNDKLQLDYTFDFPENHFMIENEALTCRQRVALFNMSYFTKLFLSGPDAQKAVDWIFSNDMRKPNGSTVYTCMLNKRAGIEGDLTVSVVEASETGQVVPIVDGRCFYIAVGGAMGQYAISHLNDIIQDNKFDVRLDDKSDDVCLLSVQGPRSRDVLQPLCNSDLSDEAFPFSTNKLVTIAGHEVLAMRVSFVGELGWELHVPSSTAVDVYHAVMAAGAEKGICNAGYRAIDALSIEKGYRHWHGDVRPDDSPLESGLMFTCKLKTDVPFLGRDALEERRKWGAKKKLACFTIDEHVALQSLEAIYRDGLPVGYLRRADYAFALGKSIGYGYVHHPQGETVNNAFLKSGEYHIERMGVKYPATLHLKTPFDPKNERVKGIYTTHVDPMVKQAQN